MIIEHKVNLKNKTKDELIAFIEQLQNLLNKKNKIIDLMAEYIGNEDITEIFCNGKEYCDEDCKQCVEQYFERKVEECLNVVIVDKQNCLKTKDILREI